MPVTDIMDLERYDPARDEEAGEPIFRWYRKESDDSMQLREARKHFGNHEEFIVMITIWPSRVPMEGRAYSSLQQSSPLRRVRNVYGLNRTSRMK